MRSCSRKSHRERQRHTLAGGPVRIEPGDTLKCWVWDRKLSKYHVFEEKIGRKPLSIRLSRSTLTSQSLDWMTGSAQSLARQLQMTKDEQAKEAINGVFADAVDEDETLNRLRA